MLLIFKKNCYVTCWNSVKNNLTLQVNSHYTLNKANKVLKKCSLFIYDYILKTKTKKKENKKNEFL